MTRKNRSWELLNSKGAKRYVTEGSPVDLILYFDLRFGTTASVGRLCERHTDLLELPNNNRTVQTGVDLQRRHQSSDLQHRH